MDSCRNLSSLEETSPCYLLSVRVIRARNLREGDAVTPTDGYLMLWMPTASSAQFRTKTVQNCKDPVWNETFHFMVQSRAKNVLELGVYDEDFCFDDHLFTLCFDIAGLQLNEKVLMCFNSNLKKHEQLEIEFEMSNRLSVLETIITNGVLLSRQLCHLQCEVESKRKQTSKGTLTLMVKGSHEENQEFNVSSSFCLRSRHQSSFHYIKYKHQILEVNLPKKDLEYSFDPCSYNKEENILKVEINSIPINKKIVLAESKNYVLHVTTEDCQPGLDVRLGYDLCPQEQSFLCKRKRIVADALKKVLKLERDLQDHEVPVVAIMTTGGSTRSLTALYGSLRGLQKLNLLDCATYITGLSGTTWTMGNLYKDAYWSKKDLTEQINEAKKHVTKSKKDNFSMERLKYYNSQLRQRKEEGQRTSCIDVWGLMIEYLLNDGNDARTANKSSAFSQWTLWQYILPSKLVEEDNHKLSDEQHALNEGQNPLPIYTAINVKEKYSTMDFNEWMEFTPYEVGILKYGAYVKAEDFGSEFFMGRLIKRLPETRLCYMQGMWSSALSVNLLYFWSQVNSSEEFWHKWTHDQITDIDEEPQLPSRLHAQNTHLCTPEGPFSCAFRDVLTSRLSIAQYHNFLKGLQLDNGYLQNDNFCRWKGAVLDPCSPNQLTQTDQYLSLEDTGFFINTSSAPLMRKERKVDVILHLNYSAGSQSLPLKQSCKYYAEQGIPFPKTVLNDDDKHLKECYLFEEENSLDAPILLFFPQVNDTFRYYKAPGVKRSESEMKYGDIDISSKCGPYSTYSTTFSKEEYDQLVDMSEYNILNNQYLIRQALQRAVERKKLLKK